MATQTGICIAKVWGFSSKTVAYAQLEYLTN